MALPEISIILPVYNAGHYLRYSVESVLNQTLSNFEFLIMDDCSTDDSYEYLKNINDSRVRLFRNDENKGLFYNLNFMIQQSNAPLIKLWAQDDIMYPSCLHKFVTFHRLHPEIGFSYSARDIINENNEVVKPFISDYTPEIISGTLHAEISYEHGSIAGNIANVCIAKAAIQKVGLFNESMRISADFEMQVRIAAYYPVGFIKKALVQIRDHAQQLSRNPRLYLFHVREDFEVYRILNEYVSPELKKRGQLLLRKKKLMFYYTLMLKSFLKFDFNTGMAYLRILRQFDSPALLTFQYIKFKLGFRS